MKLMRNALWPLLVALMFALSLATLGCEEDPVSPIVSADPSASPVVAMRIVTLAPALTQMVVDLGFEENIVGAARGDAAAPAHAVSLGTFQEIDYERLLQLEPTHVLMMTDKDGVPARLREMALVGGFTLAAFASPERILDVNQMLVLGSLNEDGDSVAKTLHAEDAGFKLLSEVQSRLDAIAKITTPSAQDPPPLKGVLMLIGTNPLMASGPGTVHDEVLSKYVYAFNAAQFASSTAPVYDRERLLELKPDVILLILPGALPLGPIDQDVRLAELRGLDIPAVVNHRIVLINHPLAGLPSTSIAIIAAEMAKAVHPQLADRIDRAMTDRAPLKPSEQAPPAAGSANPDDA